MLLGQEELLSGGAFDDNDVGHHRSVTDKYVEIIEYLKKLPRTARVRIMHI
jgi:hypothetical protein